MTRVRYEQTVLFLHRQFKAPFVARSSLKRVFFVWCFEMDVYEPAWRKVKQDGAKEWRVKASLAYLSSAPVSGFLATTGDTSNHTQSANK